MNLANLQLSSEEMRLVRDPGWILTKNSVISKVVELMGGLAGRYREIWDGDARAGEPGDAWSSQTGDAWDSLTGDAWSSRGGFGGDGDDSRAPVGIGRIEAGNPKVSRGENYRGLPWVMLDYPRVFGREDVLAIRTLFWWGHSFSVTLHLKGAYQDLYLPVIRERRMELAAAGFHVGVSEDEWRHEHTPEVFRPIAGGGIQGGGGRHGRGETEGGGFQGGGETEGGEIHGGDVKDDAAFGGGAFFKLSAAVELDRWAEAPELLAGLFGILVGVLREA